MIPRDWDEQRDWVLNHPLEAADIVADAVALIDIVKEPSTHSHHHTRLADALERLVRHDR